MVSLPSSIQYLHPSAIQLVDYQIIDNGTGPTIELWNTAKLGPQPTAEQLAAVTQAQVDAARLTRQRNAAKDALASNEQQSNALIRAVVLLMLDEFNAHSAKTNAILDAIDGATSLANLKTAVSAIANLPIRTNQQLRIAIENKLDAGDAD
jgi:hypothetical protein